MDTKTRIICLLVYGLSFLPLYPYFLKEPIVAGAALLIYVGYVALSISDRQSILKNALPVFSFLIIALSFLTRFPEFFIPLALFPFVVSKLDDDDNDKLYINIIAISIILGATVCFILNNSYETSNQVLVYGMPYIFAILSNIIFYKLLDDGKATTQQLIDMNKQLSEKDDIIKKLQHRLRHIKEGANSENYMKIIIGMEFEGFDYQSNIQKIVNTVKGATKSIFASYYEFDSREDAFMYKYSVGESLLLPKENIPRGIGYIGSVYNSKNYSFVSDLQSKEKDEFKKQMFNGVNNLLAFPITVKDQVKAVVVIGLPPLTKQKSMDVVNICQMIARQASNEFDKIAQHEKIEKQSITDKLTGLYNRQFFDAKIKEEFESCVKEGKRLAYVQIDLDYFKQMNDTHGHDFGDKVLQAAANVFKKNIRSSDYAFRQGGDEFSLLLLGADKQSAWKVAKKIEEEYRTVVEKNQFFAKKDGKDVKSSFSIGISYYPHSKVEDSASLIKLADEAVYYVKEHGKNMVAVAKDKKE